jgi:predicted DNA-binding protein
MKKLLIYLEEERHEDLKRLAQRHKTTMASLIRQALESTFEDELDAMRGERRLEEHLRDPAGSISLDDLLEEMGIVLPGRTR